MDVVKDEVAFLSSLVRLEDARLLELGCGAAEFTRRLLLRTKVGAVTALEVDRIQHGLNLAGPQEERLTFGFGGAEEIPCDDETFDGVLMMKSLHHVPVASMAQAFREIRRVLKPGGWAYISEPVYAGTLNDIIKLFHDEGAVRAAAYNALRAATRAGVLQAVSEHWFEMPGRYASYEDFVTRHVETTHSQKSYPPEVAAEVRRRLEAHMTPTGAHFMRPMRINLLRRPA